MDPHPHPFSVAPHPFTFLPYRTPPHPQRIANHPFHTQKPDQISSHTPLASLSRLPARLASFIYIYPHPQVFVSRIHLSAVNNKELQVINTLLLAI